MDMLGELIDPRHDDEPLYKYKDRLSEVADAMLQRDLTPEPGSESWKKQREKELEGRVGETLTLIDGSGDTGLIEQADQKVLTYDNVEEREGPIRWPDLEPRGVRPRYGYAENPKGGVASPESLRLREAARQVVADSGYVLADGILYYVPGRLNVITYSLPAGTEKTVLAPWQIQSEHPHRIVAEDESAVRLIGADGHEHRVALQKEGPAQIGYDAAESGRSNHSHLITPVDANGPVFAATTPEVMYTGQGYTSENGKTSADGFLPVASGRAFPVPHLQAVEVTTDPDQTGHAHTAKVSPHDYWSGSFLLPGDNHSHRVENWSVKKTAGHAHTLPEPDVPEARALVPRLVSYEGDRMFEHSQSPHVLNISIEDGWTVAEVPGGFSGQLVLGFETGRALSVPVPDTDSDRTTIGVGPKEAASQLYVEILQARAGFDIVLRVRAEDSYTGGVPNHRVCAKWTMGGSDRSVEAYTDETGETLLHVPTEEGTTSYDVEVCGDNGLSQMVHVELDYLGEPGGYGIDYGIDYGA